ncbi:MAG: hypothetical protein ABI585_01330 [Betaproteobacteria bacterium]
MIRRIDIPERPYGRDDLDFVREGRAGACFRGRDGLDIRLAVSEREPAVHRERLSLIGVLAACIASGITRK